MGLAIASSFIFIKEINLQKDNALEALNAYETSDKIRQTLGHNIASRRYNRALAGFTDKDYPYAIEKLENCIQKDPTIIDYHALLARSYFLNGEFTKSVNAYTEVRNLVEDGQASLIDTKTLEKETAIASSLSLSKLNSEALILGLQKLHSFKDQTLYQHAKLALSKAIYTHDDQGTLLLKELLIMDNPKIQSLNISYDSNRDHLTSQ